MKLLSTLALVLLTATVASADPPAIKNNYAFEVGHTEGKCEKVTGALLTTLQKKYSCGKPPASKSGKKLVADCLSNHGNSRYMVLRSVKDCNEERDARLADPSGDE